MATTEHKELAFYIKNVHLSLRQKSEQIGYEEAWKEHCKNEDCLQKYANSMKELATKHWHEKAKENSKVISRIEWVVKFCKDYFTETSLVKWRTKETEVLSKINEHFEEVFLNICDINCLDLLDVGSCYNPFKIYDMFKVVAIDIAPACENVYKCDFTNVNIADSLIFRNNVIEQFNRDSFHIVVFSLLLEYLPSPNLRLICCKQAYNVLKHEGVLIIITPDSKHVGANAKYMKSWQYTLALLGFARIKYEKLPYLHCMVFRKCLNCKVSERWAKLHENKGLSDTLQIPQDLHEHIKPNIKIETTPDSTNYLLDLPFNMHLNEK